MLSKITRCSLLCLLAWVLMAYDMPNGWYASGSNPNAYEMGIDPGAGQNGKNAATIRALRPETYGYGRLIQKFASDKYKGKRLKLTGFLRTKNVSEWAGLLMKVEGKSINRVTGKEQNKVLSLDNMYNRFVSGTTHFTKYEIVLDVPDSSSYIMYGLRLTGSGQIWLDQVSFEVVGKDVPVTSSELNEPTNIDFDK